MWPTGWAASAPAQEWLAAVPLIIERFPDLAFARGRSVTSGDLTMVELRMTGTEASGEHLLADGVVVFVVRDDLVVEERHYWLYADVAGHRHGVSSERTLSAPSAITSVGRRGPRSASTSSW